MKRVIIATIVFAGIASLARAGVPEGKTLFASKCQPCHGPNGEGKPAIAKMYNVTMPALASKEVQGKNDAELKKIITAGQGKMRPVSGLTDQQVNDIVAFVRTLK